MTTHRLWGGRFKSGSDPLFSQFNDSLPFDRTLLEADIEGSVAYSRALERAGVLTPSEGRRIRAGLREILTAHRRNPAAIASSDAEDVHSWVETELFRRAGECALKLHTGRSRNDQVATDLRLHLRRECDEIGRDLEALIGTIADLAEDGLDVILPGYTHLQRAQPVLWSHYLMAYAEMLFRDRERLLACRRRTNHSPLGSGALSGTVYDIDRQKLARELGFAGISANSMDAVSDRDFVLDFLYFASVLLVHLSRLSEDLVLYSTSEFGFVELGDDVTSGSSLMPQKKNPDALELIRGKSGRVMGHLMGLLTVLKGLPMSYNKDLQEDKEGLFDAIRTTTICLRMMTRVLKSVTIRPDRAVAAATEGFLSATELADYLSARGLPFRQAHHVVGRIVLKAMELQRGLESLPLEEYRQYSPLFDRDLYACLEPRAAVKRRRAAGGTSPAAVRREIRQLRRRLRGSRSQSKSQSSR